PALRARAGGGGEEAMGVASGALPIRVSVPLGNAREADRPDAPRNVDRSIARATIDTLGPTRLSSALSSGVPLAIPSPEWLSKRPRDPADLFTIAPCRASGSDAH